MVKRYQKKETWNPLQHLQMTAFGVRRGDQDSYPTAILGANRASYDIITLV